MADKTTYEVDQPWVIYRFGLTHDTWWPVWNSTRFLGYAKIQVTCLVCGTKDIIKMKMPRVGSISDNGSHPLRVAFLEQHQHPDKGHPMSWKIPMGNPAVFAHGDIPLDLLAMRLEGDINGNQANTEED
jgi:hypothetical protein